MAKSQNRTHAVMAQRHEPADSLDDFPTPPWATRALVEHVIGVEAARAASCWEPACGRGHMASALREYFASVRASDVADYGYGDLEDFTSTDPQGRYDWIITNPPFKLAEDFFFKAFEMSNIGVAMLVRTVFIESVGRLERVFSGYPPYTVAQFAERVPMVKGRLDKKASTATGYAWVVWKKPLPTATSLTWIPRCRKQLERTSDYDAEFIQRPIMLHVVNNEGTAQPQGDLFRGEHDDNIGRRKAAS